MPFLLLRAISDAGEGMALLSSASLRGAAKRTLGLKPIKSIRSALRIFAQISLAVAAVLLASSCSDPLSFEFLWGASTTPEPASGQVLVAGGANASGTVKLIEGYDPVHGVWLREGRLS